MHVASLTCSVGNAQRVPDVKKCNTTLFFAFFRSLARRPLPRRGRMPQIAINQIAINQTAINQIAINHLLGNQTAVLPLTVTQRKRKRIPSQT